jgi:ATP-dependent DNA helicase DinG
MTRAVDTVPAADRERLGIEDLLGPSGAAARCLESFEDRAAQRRMADAVLEALQVGGVVAVEAPTGVGKTLAYLVAAALSGRKVVISTNTKTLQDQIIDKDLRLLERILADVGRRLVRVAPEDGPARPGELRYALMKGRSNYLCRARLDRRTEQTSFGFESEGTLAIVRDWARTTERGDRAELAGLAEDDPLWPELDARSDACTGSRCPRYDECFIGRMRREAQLADVVIVNHHLLMSDLALKARARLAGTSGYGEVIPDADALIVDEAHALEAVASDYFGGQISTRNFDRLGKDVAAHLADSGGSAGSRAALALSRVVSTSQEVYRRLPEGDGRRRFSGRHEADAMASSREALPAAEASLDTLADALEEDPASDPAALNLAQRARDLKANLRFVLDAGDDGYVYWCERARGAGVLGASPIEVATLLSEHLFQRFGAVAMCSATLSTGSEGLGYFLEAVGAPDDTLAFELDSPYDFRKQAALYVPASTWSPDAPDATERFTAEAHALVDLVGGGALLLFTSHRAMRKGHRILERRLRYPVLLQGDKPKRDLLRTFEAEAPAVLCGTASFWEGVDIPGEALQLVVIDRLPFDSPRDPLLAARAERLERQGRSAFARLQLPRAILRFKQGFGRLVRSRNDRGIVAVLDGRIAHRGYGRRFIEALPPVLRFRDREELSRWWNEPS